MHLYFKVVLMIDRLEVIFVLINMLRVKMATLYIKHLYINCSMTFILKWTKMCLKRPHPVPPDG